MKAGFNTTILRNILWIGGSGYMMTVVGFAGNLILARLLSPEEFGIFTLAASVLVLVYMLSGFGSQEAIIQYRGKDTARFIGTAFWMSIVIGALLALVGVLLGIGAQQFNYFDPLISQLMIGLALVYFGGVCSNTLSVLLQRDLNHRPIAIIEAVSKMISFAVAIIFAWRGVGVWALFIRESAEVGLKVISLLWINPNIPKIYFDRDATRWIIKFGSRILFTRASETAYGRIDNLVVERAFGSATLGSYGMAYRLSQLGHQLTYQTIGSVMFSAFASVQASKERLLIGFERSTFWLLRLSLLVALLAFALGEAATVLLYGEKWRQAGELLVSMTPFILFLPLYENNRVLLEGINQLDQIIRATTIKFVVFIVGLLVLPLMMGLQGVIVAVNLSVLIGWLVLCAAVSRHLEVNWGRLLLRPALAFGVTLLILWNLPVFEGFGRILIPMFTTITTYLISLFIFEYKLLLQEFSVVHKIAFGNAT